MQPNGKYQEYQTSFYLQTKLALKIRAEESRRNRGGIDEGRNGGQICMSAMLCLDCGGMLLERVMSIRDLKLLLEVSNSLWKSLVLNHIISRVIIEP